MTKPISPVKPRSSQGGGASSIRFTQFFKNTSTRLTLMQKLERAPQASRQMMKAGIMPTARILCQAKVTIKSVEQEVIIAANVIDKGKERVLISIGGELKVSAELFLRTGTICFDLTDTHNKTNQEEEVKLAEVLDEATRSGMVLGQKIKEGIADSKDDIARRKQLYADVEREQSDAELGAWLDQRHKKDIDK
ncbi:MAG: hypothetical protein ABIA67_01820 [Candidatus Margulisiibacteriota bacterium]